MNVITDNGNVGLRRGPGAAARALSLSALLLVAQLPAAAVAGPNEQAKRIYERIAGVPPSAADLQTMVNDITGQSGQAGLLAAASYATSAPTFYDVTLKNFSMPWTNRDATVFSPLNDYVATVIGMVRDNV
ncbi:MAG: hypothetical protein WAK94_16405, partial [Steroidobacteraceae bacterium]